MSVKQSERDYFTSLKDLHNTMSDLIKCGRLKMRQIPDEWLEIADSVEECDKASENLKTACLTQ